MKTKSVSFEECRTMYAECMKMIPLLASREYIEEGDECYCIRDMELYAETYYVSWKEALTGMLEHACCYKSFFARIQTALLLRDHSYPPEELYENFQGPRVWRDEIWESSDIFDCGKRSPENPVSSFIDFRRTGIPKKITGICMLAWSDSGNCCMDCKSLGCFEVDSKEDLILHGIRELERIKLQGKDIVFRNSKTTDLLLLPGWIRQKYCSGHTVYGIEFGEWYCPEYRNDPDDPDDLWNDEWYGSGIQMLFDYDPGYREDYSDCPLFSKGPVYPARYTLGENPVFLLK